MPRKVPPGSRTRLHHVHVAIRTCHVQSWNGSEAPGLATSKHGPQDLSHGKTGCEAVSSATKMRAARAESPRMRRRVQPLRWRAQRGGHTGGSISRPTSEDHVPTTISNASGPSRLVSRNQASEYGKMHISTRSHPRPSSPHREVAAFRALPHGPRAHDAVRPRAERSLLRRVRPPLRTLPPAGVWSAYPP